MIVAIVGVGAVTIFGTTSASAHAQLESTDPNQSSVVLVSPRQVVLHFGEPVEIDFGSIRVLGPDGKRVDEGGTHHPAGDSHAVAISLPGHLPNGTYVVAWRVISADSHPVHGAYVFSVGSAKGAGNASSLAAALTSARGSTTVGVAFGLIRFALFAGLLTLVGLGSMVALVWPAAAGVHRIRRILWWSWLVVLACSIAGVAVQGVYAATLPLTHVLSPSLFYEVIHTRFGEVQVLRVILLIAFIPILMGIDGRLGRPGRRRWWIVPGTILGIGLLLTPGLAGHASTSGNAVLGMTIDVAHLGSAALWIGGLALLGAVVVKGVPATERPHDITGIARAFSPFAFGAVVVVVVSGLIQSVRQVGSLYALFHTVYGRTLVVKVCLVIALIALGAVSRRLVTGRWIVALPRRFHRLDPRSSMTTAAHPTGGAGGTLTRPAHSSVLAPARAQIVRAADDTPGMPRTATTALRRSVLAELLVAAAVLAASSLLVNAIPAKQAAAQPFSQSFDVLGVQVNAVIDPARVGPGNQFHFYVLSHLGQPLAIPELDASIGLPSAGVGPIALPVVVAGPGHYLATNVDIPFAGDWDLKLTVRTSPIDEQEAFAVVPVH